MSSSCSSSAQVFLDPLDGLVWLVAVVEAGSVSAAARHLDWPRASLSRRISELEASLGVTLLHRTTRKLTLTRAGEELYRRARRILEMAAEARDSVRRLDGVPRGLLRLSVPPRLGDKIHMLLLDYLQRYPETRLEVQATGRLVDLREEAYDLAIRAGAVRDPLLVAHEVGGSEVFAVASPDYLRRHGIPRASADLAEHQCLINFGRDHWPLREGGEVAVKGRLVCDDIFLLQEAACAGAGIALLPEALTEKALREGRLKAVLREQVGARSPFTLLYPSGSLLEPKVRAFVDLAVPFLSKLRFTD